MGLEKKVVGADNFIKRILNGLTLTHFFSYQACILDLAFNSRVIISVYWFCNFLILLLT